MIELRRVVGPATISLAAIGFILLLVLVKADWDPLALAKIGSLYSQEGVRDPVGYDGQFNVYIAQNPSPEALDGKLDVPSYRYQRILLPTLARIFSLGNHDFLPWAFPLISLIAHFLATRRLGEMLEKWGSSQWFALAYSLWVGSVLAIRLDLAGALSLAFAILAISQHQRGKTDSSHFLFLFAVFAKETALVFVLGQLIYYFFKREKKNFLKLFGIVVIPFAIFQFWLLQQFGSFGIGSGGIAATSFEWIPFNGIWQISQYGLGLMLAYLILFLPIAILPSLYGIQRSLQQVWQSPISVIEINLLLLSALSLILPFSLYREPTGALRMFSLLVLAWTMYAAKHRMLTAQKYSLLGISLNAIILSEILST